MPSIPRWSSSVDKLPGRAIFCSILSSAKWTGAPEPFCTGEYQWLRHKSPTLPGLWAPLRWQLRLLQQPATHRQKEILGPENKNIGQEVRLDESNSESLYWLSLVLLGRHQFSMVRKASSASSSDPASGGSWSLQVNSRSLSASTTFRTVGT